MASEAEHREGEGPTVDQFEFTVVAAYRWPVGKL